MPFDEAKLKELIVYIAKRSEDDEFFGKTKLLKLLAYADFVAYQRLGHSITGATYIKLEYGPSSREAPGALEVLHTTKRVDILHEEAFGYPQTRIVALAVARATMFSDDEIAIVDEVVETFRAYNNSQMREVSHRDFAGWQLVDEYAVIPYETVFLAPPEPLTSAEVAHVHALVRQGDEARRADAATA